MGVDGAARLVIMESAFSVLDLHLQHLSCESRPSGSGALTIVQRAAVHAE